MWNFEYPTKTPIQIQAQMDTQLVQIQKFATSRIRYDSQSKRKGMTDPEMSGAQRQYRETEICNHVTLQLNQCGEQYHIV